MPLPPTYKFRSISTLIGLYTKFGMDPKKAVQYARKQQPYMENYLLDPRCQISNNLAENAIRPFTVGRKNWLFSDTVKGAKASAVIYSLVETAVSASRNSVLVKPSLPMRKSFHGVAVYF